MFGEVLRGIVWVRVKELPCTETSVGPLLMAGMKGLSFRIGESGRTAIRPVAPTLIFTSPPIGHLKNHQLSTLFNGSQEEETSLIELTDL